MIIEYEWVNREPFLEYSGYNVQNWLFQLSAKSWLTESGKIASSGLPEAVAYRTYSAEIEERGRKHVTGYTPQEISGMSEAYRRIRDWDAQLQTEVSGELYGPKSIPSWNSAALQVSGELDL